MRGARQALNEGSPSTVKSAYARVEKWLPTGWGPVRTGRQIIWSDPGLVDFTQGHHWCYFFFDGFVCDNADPAMDFVRPLDLPSRNAADALRATTLDVCFKFLAIPTTSSTDSVANPDIEVLSPQRGAWQIKVRLASTRYARS